MTCSPWPTKLDSAEMKPSPTRPKPSSVIITGKITEVMLYWR